MAGAYNFTGDGNIGEWIKTLEAAKKLGAKVVCPGHGPMTTIGEERQNNPFYPEYQTKH